MSKMLRESNIFAVHLLASHQTNHSVVFSSPSSQTKFDQLPFHVEPSTKLPVLLGCLGVLLCKTERSFQVGDHEVWFGTVGKIIGSGQLDKSENKDPLMYYRSSYFSVGDEVFIKAFENATLSFSEWTHRAHIRMAWIYLKEFGNVETAYPHI
ncbi:hypothetical protein HK096_000514, partial [Nowakowskiella sp. JEL0078]